MTGIFLLLLKLPLVDALFLLPGVSFWEGPAPSVSTIQP